MRGDLHAHTTYCDGRSTVAEMVERAAALGYEYISLTDRSPSQRIAMDLTFAVMAHRPPSTRDGLEGRKLNQSRKPRPHFGGPRLDGGAKGVRAGKTADRNASRMM